MASIRERCGRWRAEVYQQGKRSSATFDTHRQAQQWADRIEGKRTVPEPYARGPCLDLETIIKASTSAAPICGIYFLIEGEEIVYVGQSRNVLQRLAQHWTDPSKVYNRTAYFECDEEILTPVEFRYIRKFRPRFNITGFGKGSLKNGNVPQAKEKLEGRNITAGDTPVCDLSHEGGSDHVGSSRGS